MALQNRGSRAPTGATVAEGAAFLPADARRTLRMSSSGTRPLPHLHDGRNMEMDQQLICALIPEIQLASRHITFGRHPAAGYRSLIQPNVVNSLRGDLLPERDPAGGPR